MFIFKRFILGIFTMVLVAIVLFFLLRTMPGDEVEAYSGIESRVSNWNEKQAYKEKYISKAKELHLDLPTFYFSISKYNPRKSKNYVFPFEKSNLKEALGKGYDETTSNAFVVYENAFDSYLFHLKWLKSDSIAAASEFHFFQNDYEEKSIALQKLLSDTTFVKSDKKLLKEFSENEIPIIRNTLPEAERKYFSWLPYFSWNGTSCQFHHWFARLLKGDFGNSYTTHRSVVVEIKDALKWTFFLNIMALITLFGIAIPLGLQAASQKNKRFDKILMKISNYLDALPSIWLATMVVVFLTSSYYHMKIFPSSGLGDFPYDAPFFKKILIAIPHFIAPVFCIVLTSFPAFFRQMRSAALGTIQEDFIRTAQSKGLDQKNILRKHVFPNAIFPMITLLGLTLPSIVTGSVIIENIFNIPGLGKKLMQSVYEQDFPLVVAIVLFMAIFVVLGNLVADFLYRIFDPRLSK